MRDIHRLRVRRREGWVKRVTHVGRTSVSGRDPCTVTDLHSGTDIAAVRRVLSVDADRPGSADNHCNHPGPERGMFRRRSERHSRRPVTYPPAEALLALHQRRGAVINVGFGRHGYVHLLGPEANRFVFANTDAFSWREAFEGLVPVDGPTSMIVSDGTDHRRRRSLVQPATHRRQVEGYVQIMAANTDAVIDTWHEGQTLDVYQQFRAAIRRSTIESLFGPRLAGRADFFGAHLQPLLDLIDRPPQLVAWQRRLQTPAWRRAMVARERVDELVYAEIGRVRTSSADAGDHVLAMLVNGRNESAETLTDAEVRDQVVSLIAAGYETTSAAMAWAIYLLLSIPGGWDRAAEEVTHAVGDRPPTAADLNALPYLHGVVQETLRLYPPAVISARKVTRDLNFAGHRIRAGRMLLFSPYVTHRLPGLWPEARQFLPQRWDPASPHYRKPAPDEFLPFGGGPHRCIGSVLATTEMTVMLARLLARTSPRLLPQHIRATGFAAMRPRHGLLIEVTRHSADAGPRPEVALR